MGIRSERILKNALSWLKNSRKKWKHVLLNLVISMHPLRHFVRIHGPLLFFPLSSFVCWVTCSRPPSSSNPSVSSSNPISSTPHPQTPLKEDPNATGKPDAIYTSRQVDGSYLVLVSTGMCAVVFKVLVRRLTGVGM